MTLTEQWKAGELSGGWYFLEFENGSNFPVYYCGFNKEFEFGWDWKISRVLARCSYEELEELKIDNHSLNAWIKNFQPKYKEMKKENQQLKELLKEVRDAWVIYKPYDRHQLCERIDNAIGEKK